MPISKETAQRSQGPVHDSVIDPETHQARTALLPSEVVAPTRSDTAPQQASTQPGDGGGVHTGKQRASDVTEVPASGGSVSPKVPFKEQVLGVAKKTRGTLLGKPELKQHGDMILEGKAQAHDEPASI